MAKSPYTIDPELTGIAIAYRNAPSDYIADSIAPIRSVGKEIFEWDKYTLEEMYTIPDTKVGRMSAPNQVTFSSTREQDSTVDYGLDSPVPQKDIDNADANQNPLGHATEGVMELVRLDREKRVADKTFDLNTYLAAQRTTLSGTSQWSDATSDPITAISDALDVALMRPNIMVLGQAAWTGLRRNPKIVEACVATGANQGLVGRAAVAELFELDEILVGRSFQNVAKPGQTASFTRLWGKHCALIHRSPLAQLTGSMMPTFMMTARFGTPMAGTISEPDMGLKGGVRIRAGESCKEMVISQLCGYFFQNVVA
ncbi:MAG: phage capsid protein [Jaaginema sp. PMC 1079.18]|nr:phage capsid protein [Jaaginema sp. PMC 1080.18]MEC4851201.1 phage capsid protein [Jaaginema sp. PMC 1079.18]MEC4864780.1 phage capsid protein [Jaaginema sp. PMC 1078.18]